MRSREDRNWWFCSRNDIILWALKTKVSKLDPMLEVGCGTGFVTRAISIAFPQLTLAASEYFDSALQLAKKRVSACRFILIDARYMNDQNQYNCIGSFDVLEHIDDDELVLANFNNALRPGGFLILTVPQHPWLWSPADEFAHHVRRYTKSELMKKLKRARFETYYTTSFVSLLLPIMAIQRFISRGNATYDPKLEFDIGSLLNLVLSALMSVEFLLIRLGVRLPFGGSLLVLAKKL